MDTAVGSTMGTAVGSTGTDGFDCIGITRQRDEHQLLGPNWISLCLTYSTA
jgi:hypothetical protein